MVEDNRLEFICSAATLRGATMQDVDFIRDAVDDESDTPADIASDEGQGRPTNATADHVDFETNEPELDSTVSESGSKAHSDPVAL